MAFNPHNNDHAIAANVQNCLALFERARCELNNADAQRNCKLLSEAISDELGRFHLWSGNIGAHRRGRASLDYKLREASHIRERVIELLKSLESVLQVFIAIAIGERVAWEDFSDSDTDSDDEDERYPENPPTTEAEQLACSIAEINTCLMRLSMAIRNPAPHDQFKHSAHIMTDHYEPFDIDHVRAKFPQAQNYLVLRLGKAISRRRQYLRYREEHRKRLEQGLESQPQIQDDIVPMVRFEVGSTVASSLPGAVKIGTSTIELGETDYYEDTLSQTSYASSTDDSTKLHPPPVPENGRDGEPFECPICYRFTSVRQVAAWHKHVYRDLQPYVCTIDDCGIPDRTYESRHEWFHHEMQVHRTWWECIDGCNQSFDSIHDFRSHIGTSHSTLAQENRIDDLIHSCERRGGMGTHADCPLCQLQVPSLTLLRRHMGKHLEELALFALPSHLKQEDDNEDSDDEENARSVLSESEHDPSLQHSLDANAEVASEMAGREDSDFPIPIKASVPRYSFAEATFWFVVECEMDDGRHWELQRLYQDFYDLQIQLLQAYPVEAGTSGSSERILPWMPGPVTYVTDNISSGRRANLDAYVRDLFKIPHIVRGALVTSFFRPRQGDFEIDADGRETTLKSFSVTIAFDDQPLMPSQGTLELVGGELHFIFIQPGQNYARYVIPLQGIDAFAMNDSITIKGDILLMEDVNVQPAALVAEGATFTLSFQVPSEYSFMCHLLRHKGVETSVYRKNSAKRAQGLNIYKDQDGSDHRSGPLSTLEGAEVAIPPHDLTPNTSDAVNSPSNESTTMLFGETIEGTNFITRGGFDELDPIRATQLDFSEKEIHAVSLEGDHPSVSRDLLHSVGASGEPSPPAQHVETPTRSSFSSVPDRQGAKKEENKSSFWRRLSRRTKKGEGD